MLPFSSRKCAIIVGAGPAGLTTAYELLTRTDIVPVVLEKSIHIGGLSRTVNYKGNRIDIGGHRFFSKSDRVIDWWLNFLPLEKTPAGPNEITYQRKQAIVRAQTRQADPNVEERVMLLRRRISRIYFRRKLFRYPITLDIDMLRNLGPLKTCRILFSYFRSALSPIRHEATLEDFLINRFGRELYSTFFKSYTEKVWGVNCKQISAEWGAQRLKGLSIYKAAAHMLANLLSNPRPGMSKRTETSLVEYFLYPKYGPGQMWEEVALRVRSLGGQVLTGWDVERIEHNNRAITSVTARNYQSGDLQTFAGDHFFSTMPVKDLAAAMNPAPPLSIRNIADGLIYRDFLTVGVLCTNIKLRDPSGAPIADNWIYVHQPEVLVGRLQIFNNWSPFLVADPQNVWIGLEYFCNAGDTLWRKDDKELIELAKQELAWMNIADPSDMLDATVIRMPKAYPGYFGTYNRFSEIIQWANGFENLFLIGRNGMHRYNNQDHSMLTAMTAVDNIIANVRSRDNLWELNTEQEYQEEKSVRAKPKVWPKGAASPARAPIRHSARFSDL